MTVMDSHSPITALHVVLHQHHGHAAVAHETNQFHHPPGLLRVHAGERFVKKNELGIGGKRDRHAKRALMSVRQIHGGLVGQILQPEELKDFQGLRGRGVLHIPVGSENSAEESGLRAAMAPDTDIV